MKQPWYKYKGTAIALLLSIIFYLLNLFFEIELYESVIKFWNEAIEKGEDYELDEFFFIILALIVGLWIDMRSLYIKKKTELEIQKHRLRVLHATMRSVQDIVGNALNSLQFFRIEAERNGAINEDSIEIFDQIIQDTMIKINKLSNLESTPEKKIDEDMYSIDWKGGSEK